MTERMDLWEACLQEAGYGEGCGRITPMEVYYRAYCLVQERFGRQPMGYDEWLADYLEYCRVEDAKDAAARDVSAG